MTKRTIDPSGKAIAEKLKEMYPNVYGRVVAAVLKEQLERKRQYERKRQRSAEYKENHKAYMHEYYLAHKEEIARHNREYMERTDYNNKRKLKGLQR